MLKSNSAFLGVVNHPTQVDTWTNQYKWNETKNDESLSSPQLQKIFKNSKELLL